MTEYYIPKSTGTYADALITLGLAVLLQKHDAATVYLQDHHNKFRIHTAFEPQIRGKSSLFPYLRYKSSEPSYEPQYDYVLLKEGWQQHFNFLKQNRRVKLDESDYMPPSELKRRMQIEALVNLFNFNVNNSPYAKGFVILDHLSSDKYEYLISNLLGFYAGKISQSDLKAQYDQLAKQLSLPRTLTAAMVFNPMAGMGINSKKANTVKLDNLDVLPIIEVLKFTGWWVGTAAYTPRTKNKRKDLKVLCISPQDIPLEIVDDLMTRFRETFFGGGAIQIDVLAVINFVLLLLEHHPDQVQRRRQPRKVVSGFYSTYFLNLQKAKVVSNLSFIGIPDWISIHSKDDLEAWQNVLQEHRSILRYPNLDEDLTEHYNLLLLYRDFLSGSSLEQFLNFLVGYGAFALAKADRERTLRAARAFNPHHIRKVVIAMSQNLSAILDNEGFQNVATAIRRATRGALYAKLKGERAYSVHYGLAQELARKALYKNDFVSALSDFITEYNAENMRAAERGQKRRAAVTTNDIADVVRLLEEHDAQTVAKLLIAFGYAKSPYETTDDPPAESDTEPNPDEEMTLEEVEA